MTDSTPTFDRAEFRVQLLLHLPQLGVHIDQASTKAGIASDVHPALDLNDSVSPDLDYEPEALAAWILAELDRSTAEAAAAGLEAELQGSQVVEMASAAAVISSSVEFAAYLTQIETLLKSNLGLKQQWDLARSMNAEVVRLSTLASQLIASYPALSTTLPAGLQNVAGQPLSAD